MSLSTLIPVLTALAGALVGGLISEARNYLESRRERRKALNRMLWCQLDLWFDTKRHDLLPAFQFFLSRLATRLGVPIEQLTIPPEQQSILVEIVANSLGVRDEDLDTQYKQAVEALSLFDPLLAYRLSGKTRLSNPNESADIYVNQVIERFGSLLGDNQGVLAMNQLSPFLRREMVVSFIKIIEEDIDLVALRLGRRTHRQAQRTLKDLEKRLAEDQKDAIDSGIDRFIGFIQSISPPPSDG